MRTKLDSFALDTIKEISSVGAGHASMALSMLTNDLVRVTFPRMKVCPLENVPPIIGRPEEEVANICVHIDKKSESDNEKTQTLFSLLLIFPISSAVLLADMLQGKEPDNTEMDEMDISALQEVGNILVGSYVSAISEYIDFEMIESVPDIATDMLESVMNAVMSEYGSELEDTIVFETEFIVKEQKIDGHLVMLLYCDYDILLNQIKKFGEESTT